MAAPESRFSDPGPAIPPGTEEEIFEKFHRGPHVGAGGAGLGLAICRGIVEAHGGSIRAERRATDGTLFSVRLPVVEAPPPMRPPEASTP
jgi:two-component system sensor histidine kinase KdpD